MIKFYLSIFLLIFIVHTSSAQYYTQYFEGADTSYNDAIIISYPPDAGNIWQVGPPQKIIFDTAATFPNAIVTDTVNYYPANNHSRFIAKIYPWFNWGIFAMQWKQKLDMNHDYDGGYIEYSYDHGLSWYNCFNNPYVYNFYGYQPDNADTLNTGEYAFSGTDSTWRDIWMCFDFSWMSQFSDTIFFRYTFKSDSLVEFNKEGWMIDNMFAHITLVHTVGEKEQVNYMNVYPNPTSSLLHIDIKKRQEFHIIEEMELVNSQGVLVDEWKNVPTRFWIDTRKYAAGNYILKVKTNFKSETVSVVISK
jgi:hypothetical protein